MNKFLLTLTMITITNATPVAAMHRCAAPLLKSATKAIAAHSPRLATQQTRSLSTYAPIPTVKPHKWLKRLGAAAAITGGIYAYNLWNDDGIDIDDAAKRFQELVDEPDQAYNKHDEKMCSAHLWATYYKTAGNNDYSGNPVKQVLRTMPEQYRKASLEYIFAGDTLLHAAVLKIDARAIEVFLEAGAEVNAEETTFNKTPLFYAIVGYLKYTKVSYDPYLAGTSLSIIKMLVKAGAHIDEEMLFSVIRSEDPSLINVLMKDDADTDTIRHRREKASASDSTSV